MAELFKVKFDPETMRLPRRLVSRLRLEPGDEVEVLVGDDNSLIAERSTDRTIHDMPAEERASLNQTMQQTVSDEEFNHLRKKIQSSSGLAKVAERYESGASS